MLYVLYFLGGHIKNHIQAIVLVLIGRVIGWTKSLVYNVLVEVF